VAPSGRPQRIISSYFDCKGGDGGDGGRAEDGQQGGQGARGRDATKYRDAEVSTSRLQSHVTGPKGLTTNRMDKWVLEEESRLNVGELSLSSRLIDQQRMVRYKWS
jgi:hypothetical protein